MFVEIGKIFRGIRIQALAFGVFRLLRMRLEIKVGPISDAHQLVPMPLFVFAFGEEAILNVHGAFGVVRQFFLWLFVKPEVAG